jgi:hypothetical protein
MLIVGAALILLAEMHIFMTRRETLLDVSGNLLTAENRYHSKGCWNL